MKDPGPSSCFKPFSAVSDKNMGLKFRPDWAMPQERCIFCDVAYTGALWGALGKKASSGKLFVKPRSPIGQ
jgi:hypothetical protein